MPDTLSRIIMSGVPSTVSLFIICSMVVTVREIIFGDMQLIRAARVFISSIVSSVEKFEPPESRISQELPECLFTESNEPSIIRGPPKKLGPHFLCGDFFIHLL